MWADEDRLVEILIGMFKANAVIPGSVNIYDSKIKPISENAFTIREFNNRSELFSFYQKTLKAIKRGRRRWRTF